MSTDRKLPVVIYGLAPVPDWTWHKDKRVSTNTDYSGDLCRIDRKAELRKRALYLEEPFPRAPEHLDGITRAKLEPAKREMPIAPLQVPKGATAVYCVKTGQHVGQMLTSYEYPPHAVHPDWIATDGSNLDTMQNKDARAYVAFCLGLIDTFWRQKPQRGQKLNARYVNKVDALEHHWSLVKAYDTLGKISDIHLRELANALCRFCTYAPLAYRVLDDEFTSHQRQADQLANVALDGSLLRSLEKATVRTLARAEGFSKAGASVKTPKFEVLPTSIEDAAKGPSNIRSQQKSGEYQKNARQTKLMAELMREFGGAMGWANIKPKRPQSSNLLARLSAGSSLDRNVQHSTGSDAAELDLLAELERHMQGASMAWDSDDTDDDDDDNEVEVRTIPRELVPSYSEHATSFPVPSPAPVTMSEIFPQETPKPKLGMFARLAGKKE